MSIEDEIIDLAHREMRHAVVPRAPGARIERAMFANEELYALLNSPIGDYEWEQRVAHLRADLERFVTGDSIDPKYLFLLYKSEDCVWEIRSTGEKPSIRVLGLFAAKDVFIATNFATRESLGGWESREWKEVKRAALAAWRRLFNSYRPLSSMNVKDLVSGALDGKYFRY